MLKFLEIGHRLNRQKTVLEEKKQVQASMGFKESLIVRLGLTKRTKSTSAMTTEEVAENRKQAKIADEIFTIFRESIEIMDEVDIILHPLKSELNWPLGELITIIYCDKYCQQSAFPPSKVSLWEF